MPTLIPHAAFFRAINTGARKLPMSLLAETLASLGHAKVSTLLNSGNALFTPKSPRTSTAMVESQIEAALRAAAGFEVETFVRPIAALAEIAAGHPFAHPAVKPASTQVYLLKSPLSADLAKKILAFSDPANAFSLPKDGTHFYWHCRTNLLDSPFMKFRLPVLHTARNLNTLQRLLEKA